MAHPQVVVDFIADTTGLARGVKEAGAETSGFGTKLKSLAKGAAFAAGAAGIAGLTEAVKLGIDKYTETQKITAQTAAALKSTGDAAHVTAKHVDELAKSIEHKSGIDDDTIHSGENLLLTFTSIRNEAGKGNKIFDRATHTITDMSVALGEPMRSAALQLGKALNDPVKGVTALHRVGVQFTAGQKDQVKAMVDAGNTMGAQKLILKELNKEFGGSATALGKTLPGQIDIAKARFKDLAGDLVAKVVPILENLFQTLQKHWPEIEAAFTKAWATVKPILAALGDDVVALVKLFQDNWPTIKPLVETVAQVLQDLAKVVAAVFKLIADLISGNWAAAWKDFKNIITDVLTAVVDEIKSVIQEIKTAFTLAWAAIKLAASLGWDAIKAIITAAWDAIKTKIDAVLTDIKNMLSKAWDSIRTTVTNQWNAVRTTISNVIDDIKNLISGVTTWLSNTAGAALSKAVDVFKGIFGGIKQGALDAVHGVKDAIGSIASWLRGIVNGVESAAQSVADAIKKPINWVINAWNSLSFKIPSIPIPSVKILGHKIGGGSIGGETIGFPHIDPLAKGGVVSHPTLALVGEGQGREIVAPERLLRQIMGENQPQVRVFIGDTELRGLVRTEVVDANSSMARTLLAGTSG